MLSKHNPKSRARVTTGIAGAAALTLAGLALTASGAGAVMTQADAPTPPAAPEAPAAPAAVAAVQAPETPAAPDAPKAPEGSAEKRVHRIVMVERKDKDGKEVKTETRVIRMKGDGKEFVWTGDMDIDIDVKSMKCGGSKDDAVKVETRDGDKRKVVICTDRIEMRADAAEAKAKGAEALARRAQVFALASADMGKRHAMMGLKMARSSIEAQTELSAEQKAAALKGIDDAIRELETAEKD